MTSYHAIVIGGGHNGLVAAATLARAGRKVLVLEAASQAGGAARTEEFFPGFRVSSVAHVLNRLHPDVVKSLELDKHGLSFAQGGGMPSVALSAKGEPLTLTGAYGERLVGAATAEQAAWKGLRAQLFRYAGILKPFLARRPPDLEGMALAETLALGQSALALKKLGKEDMRELSPWDRLMAAGQSRGIRAIGYTALNRARLEAGLIVANADFTTAEHALRAGRVRMPDEIGLGFMIDLEKGHFNGRKAIVEARKKGSMRHVLVGLEIEGNIPAEHAIVYHRQKKEVGLVSAAIWSPMAKRNIALASLTRPYGDTATDDLWVEIYAMRELKYERMMKRAKVVPRPFIKLDRRTANPPADF